MMGRLDLSIGRNRERALTAVRVLFAVGMLSGCSSVPDAVNPVEWYKGAERMIAGDDETPVAEPVPAKGQAEVVSDSKTGADSRDDLTEGLPADRTNSKYAEPVRREVTPTKQLARRTPPPAGTQVASAEGVPPKPAVTAQALPGTARDDGPNAPPDSVNMTPPAPADIPETVPARGGRQLQAQFQRRLAESAQQSLSPNMVASYGGSPRYEEEPIHLVPPSSTRNRVKGGGKGMAAPEPVVQPAASFQVASLDFNAGSANLTSADRASIAEVARVYRQTGGVVRVVGHAPAPLFGGDDVQQMMGSLDAAMKRADAVARELTKRGVPARKIMVGADPSAAGMVSDVGAQVYIDVI